MDQKRKAIEGVPRELLRELRRFAGTNPHGEATWRVVLAQNVLEQSFGVMRHMPRVDVDADITDIEPEKVEAGEFWTPRYQLEGWILERWFPPKAWGETFDWEMATSEDGVTRMTGEYPRHGDYYMVGDGPYRELPGIGFWKEQVQMELRRMAAAPIDPSTYLSTLLYLEKTQKELKREDFAEEVNALHRGITDPALATVSRTAQMMRNQLATEWGYEGNIAAG